MTNPADIQSFIDRWQISGAAERANYQLFLSELCDVLAVPKPEPTTPDDSRNSYVFEKSVPLPHGTTGRIDLYKRGCFVLEAKQGSDKVEAATKPLSEAGRQQKRKRKRGTAVRGTTTWDIAMNQAMQQAQSYARNLPPSEIEEGRPPFLVVVDVGNTIALYSEFTRTGGNYIPFPDPNAYRIALADLVNEEVRDRLHQVWTDPQNLDPSRRSARVTRGIAAQLAQLARSLEGEHPPEEVANFLMRCLFTMFAEDVELLPERSFTQLLADIQKAPEQFKPMVEHLWQTMNTGGFSVILRADILHFNGGLFSEPTALSLNADQLHLLVEAAKADWRDVEPAIFGTLLERALDPVERHKLGAHYTPRAYVERLVQPTVIEPLRAEWEGVQTAAALLADEGKSKQALAEIEAFQRRLATVRILDPACGSGNFLYVTLEHLKRLEGEVLNTRHELGQSQTMLELESVMVTPQQFFGIEVNPRAAAIAELVLWIGYLQWHFRTRGETMPPSPIIKNYHNIECRDAVLAWDSVEPLLDDKGNPVTHWDGRTTKPHPVTGQEVPDETARVPAYKYLNPRPAEWPNADFVVGNPPFVGDKRMREILGDGYTSVLRKTYSQVPQSTDYVMYWWYLAAELTYREKINVFGFITTNSLRQTFNRRILETFLSRKDRLSIVFAIPDHPWIDSSDGADVRIAMTVAKLGEQEGALKIMESEIESNDAETKLIFQENRGQILSDLTIGANVAGAVSLGANEGISINGVGLYGRGFVVTPQEAILLGLGKVSGLGNYIRPLFNGRDLTSIPRNRMVIDLYGLTVEQVREVYPEIYQWVYERVKPERDAKVGRTKDADEYARNWWIFGKPRVSLRKAIADLNQYIVTPRTAKHRIFTFLPSNYIVETEIIVIALGDYWQLGVLSSRAHTSWALVAGTRLGVGNDPRYNNSRCFATFPFPDPSDTQKSRICDLTEQLDAHRKRQQTQHPKLTMTNMYNVLEKLRAGESLTKKEQETHEQGLVSILKQLHDDLDAAVFEAYGWPADLSDEEILERLVALNAERAAEEAKGQVRWLRPEYQAPDEVKAPTQAALIAPEEPPPTPAKTPKTKLPWPKSMAEQAQAIRTVLQSFEGPVTAKQVASSFKGARAVRVTELLETLVMLGQVIETEDGLYVGQ